MNEKYRHLCAADRKVIRNMKQAGNSQQEIGNAIGFSQSTVSKELSRNRGGRGYRSGQAERLAREERERGKRPRSRMVVGATRDEVEARLQSKHSPDQISRKLALEGIVVSHEAIYQHVFSDKCNGSDLWRELRINGRRRYRRRRKVGRLGKIPNRVDIEQRPAEIAGRERYGTGKRTSSKALQAAAICPRLTSGRAGWGSYIYWQAKAVAKRPLPCSCFSTD